MNKAELGGEKVTLQKLQKSALYVFIYTHIYIHDSFLRALISKSGQPNSSQQWADRQPTSQQGIDIKI